MWIFKLQYIVGTRDIKILKLKYRKKKRTWINADNILRFLSLSLIQFTLYWRLYTCKIGTDEYKLLLRRTLDEDNTIAGAASCYPAHYTLRCRTDVSMLLYNCLHTSINNYLWKSFRAKGDLTQTAKFSWVKPNFQTPYTKNGIYNILLSFSNRCSRNIII